MAKEIIARTGEVILVDDDDFDAISQFPWSIGTSGYAERKIISADGRRVTMFMHRMILGLTVGSADQPLTLFVDHINRERLDNTKANLRLASTSQNAHNVGLNAKNTSGFKGVNWRPDRGKWEARIRVKDRRIRLGYFAEAEDAYSAYCEAAKRLHGEFANLG